MKFKMVVYHSDRVVVLRLLEFSGYEANATYYSSKTGHFKIKSASVMEFSYPILYLPGGSDVFNYLPRSLSKQFANVSWALYWLKEFTIAYTAINGVEPEIIDLNCDIAYDYSVDVVLP